MATKGYTTRAKIENYLLINIDASFHAQVDSWIEEIEEYIDRKTGRNFKADSAASVRRFDGDNRSKLLIDDCIAVTEVKLSVDADALIVEDDYILYPANAPLLSRAIPYSMIKLLGGYFPDYPPQGIYVKGKWGYSAVAPADIQTVATVLVAGIINYSWNAEGEIQSESIGRYQVTYKTEKQWTDFERVPETLKSYTKFSF